MSTIDNNNPSKAKPISETGQDSAMMSRRRLLKAGAASAPIVISLQSGTAWAQSLTCADKTVFPVLGQTNRGELIQVLEQYGMTGTDLNTVVEDFDSPEYNGSEAHMAYLQVEVTSCFASITLA